MKFDFKKKMLFLLENRNEIAGRKIANRQKKKKTQQYHIFVYVSIKHENDN